MVVLGANVLSPVSLRAAAITRTASSSTTSTPADPCVLPPSTTASSAPSPSPTPFVGIVATPSTGLSDGQYVKIIFCNLQPGEALFFRQCIANFNPAYLTTTDCTARSTRTYGKADGNGGGSMYYPVYAYKDDALQIALPSTNKTLITCDNDHPCALVASTNRGHTYVAQISFAASADICPPEPANAVLGNGTDAANIAVDRWRAATCEPPKSLSMSYTLPLNEHSSYHDFLSGSVDYGITPLEPPGTASPTSSSPTYKLAPLTASGVVIAYRAYDLSGTQITNLTLTPDMIARIFMGQVNNFETEADITALNPGVTFPPLTQVVARGDFSSETYIFTSWLAAAAPHSWKPPPSTAPDVFPSVLQDLRTGEKQTALDVVDPASGFDPFHVYLGVMDSSTAAFYGLPTVKIAMPDGSAVSENSASVLKAISEATVASDGSLIPKWSNPDKAAYPMPMLTYMIAPTNTIDPTKGDMLAKFLRYSVQDGQKLLTGDDGYVRLPANLVQLSLNVADQIPVPAPPSTATPTPTPEASPLPALPTEPLPAAPAATTPAGTIGNIGSTSASSSRTTVASNSRIAALSYSQGLQLAAAAHQELGVPEKLILPSLLGLTLLLVAGGVGLRVWSQQRAGPALGPPG
jgi:phosphate transport system substrate-binding protein